MSVTGNEGTCITSESWLPVPPRSRWRSATLAAPVGAAGSTTRWVDDDGHAGPGGCGGAAPAARSIQSAVDASHADGVVVVCPGTYVEQVRIRGSRDGLTIRASKPYQATIKGPSHIDRPLGFGYLVLVDHVDGVTIRGFKVLTRTAAPCDETDVTIGIIGSEHAQIRGNRLLAPGSDGTEACSQALGIAVVNDIEGGQPGGSASSGASAIIVGNEVRDARFGGIVSFAVDGHVHVDVSHNSLRAYFGQQSGGTSAITDVEGAQFGIGFLGRSRGTATDNVIQGASSFPMTGATFFAGVAVIADVDTSPQRNGPITIRGNLIRRVIVGIQGQTARQLTVRRNDVSNVAAGIDFERTTGSTVIGNHIRSKEVGIYLGNRRPAIPSGQPRVGQGGFCVDETIGAARAATANIWSEDVSTHGSSPWGLRCPVSPELACEQRPGSTRASLVRTPSAAPPGRPDLHR